MEKTISLYIDCPKWNKPIKIDDFIIAIGKNKSNSVYHIAKVKTKIFSEKRIIRYYVKVYKSDLITCLKRDENQQLIPLTWYKRNKNNGRK